MRPEGESIVLATRDIETMQDHATWRARRRPGRYTGRILHHEPIPDPEHLVSLPTQAGRWSEVVLEVKP